MAGIPGTSLDDHTKELIRDFNLGGIILFSRNIKDPVQLARLCRDIQNTALRYHGTPIFLAVDQEGGRVARLKEPFTLFPGNEEMGKDKDPNGKAEEFGIITATEMSLVGLNMNLAPVLDVSKGETEKHLKGRTFSDDHKKIALLGTTVIRSLQNNGVLAVAKHFPGLGRADNDPHFNLPCINDCVKVINEINLYPFRAAIKEGVSAIMTSHAIYPALDSEHPATLSKFILDGLLRKDLGYDGLIITDDLEMGAITEKWGVAQGALESFKAGSDILLICEGRKNILESIRLIRKNILQGEISYERLAQTNARIIKSKSAFIKGKKIILKKVKKYFKL